MMKPAPRNTGPTGEVRDRNMATKVPAAMTGIRKAGSARLRPNRTMVTPIASRIAIPASAAVITVEAASPRDTNSTMYADSAGSGMRKTSLTVTVASTRIVSRSVLARRPGVGATDCRSSASGPGPARRRTARPGAAATAVIA